MAKGKHAAALFEVIQQSRLPKRSNSLRVPRWWFKRRAKPGSTPFAFSSRSLDAPVATIAAPPVEVMTTPITAPPAASPQKAPSKPTQPIKGVDLVLDTDRQQITFKVSYTSAIVTAFTVVVVVALAYAIGAKMRHGPTAASASPSTEELRSRPPHPEVLNLAGGPTAPVKGVAELASAKSPGKTNGASTPLPVSPASVDSDRVIGRHYVIVQSYPDEASAREAVALLGRNNIPCTVEHGVTGWANSMWFCVVGTTGFDRVRSNGEYDKYEESIKKVSEQFAGNSKFKKFDPQAYRWKKQT